MLRTQLDKYQEQPELLDPHLESMIVPLLAIVKEGECLPPAPLSPPAPHCRCAQT
jgi:hypothetical protein